MNNKSTLRWGVEQRLEFIEFRAFWEGGINRSDITNFFGVSVPQASKDLSQYQELAPDNLKYDRSQKRYFPTSKFKPQFLKPNADQYLAHLKSAANLGTQIGRSWLAVAPHVDTMPVPHRRVEPAILRNLLHAINNDKSIEVLYQSMNTEKPDPQWRRMTPCAFVSDGLRWHIRAYCYQRRTYRDFILSRCMDTRNEDTPEKSEEGDQEWEAFFDVTLTPNPALSEAQRKVIAYDYEMTNDCITLPVRRALLYYFNKRMRFDVAEKMDNPQEVPVVVKNKAEFEDALKM